MSDAMERHSTHCEPQPGDVVEEHIAAIDFRRVNREEFVILTSTLKARNLRVLFDKKVAGLNLASNVHRNIAWPWTAALTHISETAIFNILKSQNATEALSILDKHNLDFVEGLGIKPKPVAPAMPAVAPILSHEDRELMLRLIDEQIGKLERLRSSLKQ